MTCATPAWTAPSAIPTRHRARTELEPGQDDAEHQVEALALLAEQLTLGDRRVERHRRARVAAQPEALPRGTDVDAGGVVPHQVEAGCERLVRPLGTGRDDVRLRVAGAGDERLLRADLPVRDLADGRPEVAARPALAERERPQPLPRRQATQGLGVARRRAGERHLRGADVHQVDHGRRRASRRQRAGRLEELGGTAAGAAGRSAEPSGRAGPLRRARRPSPAGSGRRGRRMLRSLAPRRGRGRDRREVRWTSVGLLLELHHGCTRPGARTTRSSSAHHGGPPPSSGSSTIDPHTIRPGGRHRAAAYRTIGTFAQSNR